MSPEPPKVSLREVTKDTLHDILRLEVAPEQKFVEPNAVSIVETHFSPDVA